MFPSCAKNMLYNPLRNIKILAHQTQETGSSHKSWERSICMSVSVCAVAAEVNVLADFICRLLLLQYNILETGSSRPLQHR